MMRAAPRLPFDVRARRFFHYAVQLSCARQVWVAMRGTRVVTRYGFPVLRRMRRPRNAGGYLRRRAVRKLIRGHHEKV